MASSGPNPDIPDGPCELKSAMGGYFCPKILDLMLVGPVEDLVGLQDPVVGQCLAINFGLNFVPTFGWIKRY